jgi:hypothetical protein
MGGGWSSPRSLRRVALPPLLPLRLFVSRFALPVFVAIAVVHVVVRLFCPCRRWLCWRIVVVGAPSSNSNHRRIQVAAVEGQYTVVQGQSMSVGRKWERKWGNTNHDESRGSFWGRTIRASHFLGPPSCFYSPIPSSSELEPPTSLWKGEGRMEPGPRSQVN